MSKTDDLMKEVTVNVYNRDGTESKLKANLFQVLKHNLEDAVVHPFVRNGNVILFILEDGEGNEMISDKGKKGISLPALITGQKHKFGYKNDDMYDNTFRNIISRRDK